MDEPETDKIEADSRAFHGEVKFTSPENSEFSLEKNISSIDQLTEARRTDLPAVESLWAEVRTHVEENADEISRRLTENLIQALRAEYERQAEAACESEQWDRFESSFLFSSLEDLKEAVEDGPNGNPLPDRTPEDWKEDPPERIVELAENYMGGDTSSDEVAEQWARQAASVVTYEVSRIVDRWFQSNGADLNEVSDSRWQKWLRDYLKRGPELSALVDQIMEHGAVQIVEILRWSGEEQGLTPSRIERFLGLVDRETAPAPRPSPSPFDLATGVATFPTDPATRSNLKGVSGEGDWIEDSFGRPVYRYTIQGPPWDGNAQLSVKEAIEAETAWKMLRDGKGEDRPAQFHADAVALYLLFLAYAGDQAPENRPGGNGEFRIRGQDAFRILNLPSGWDLQKKVRHVYNLNSYLNSFQLQLKRVTYEGQKKRTDAISPAQLWDTYLRGVQEEDLHGNVTNIEFWIEGREGAWADLFVHDNDNWTPWGGLPIRMLEDMDGRNRFNRLILFRVWVLFRVEKGTVKRTGDDLLKWCRVVPDELSRQTVSRRRTTILNALEEIKQKGFHIDDSRLRAAQGAPLEDWQAQPVYFYPPSEIVKACPQVQAPKGELPEPRSEVWTGKRVRALRKHIGETQGEFGKRLPNREGGMGVKQPRVSTIEQGNHSLTERQEEELDEMAKDFNFEG